MDGIKPPLPPPQHADRDLTSNTNGKARPENAPMLTPVNGGYKSPATLMHELGFTPTKHMTPLQFLVAVYNDDLDLVFKNQKKKDAAEAKGGISLSYRVECAKSAGRYMHMEMPKVSVTDEGGNFGAALADAARAGDKRVERRTTIIETVENISPDMPLASANYPPMFASKGRVIDQDGIIEGDPALNPEGEKGYNPDVDD
jgi:hypothetical protein